MAKDRNRKNRIRTNDAFSNPAARTGFGTLDLTQGTNYTPTMMSENYALLTSLYRDNWIVQNIVQLVPQDICRKWFDVSTAADNGHIATLERLSQKTGLRRKIHDGLVFGRLYGGAVGLIMIKGQTDYSLPLDYKAILPGSFLGLHILDRWDGVYPELSVVTDPSDPDFGLPDYYVIRDSHGTFNTRVHHSRLVRFTGRTLPYQEALAASFWGESEIEAIFNEIVKRDNVSANIAALTFRANVEYREVDGLEQLFGMNQTDAKRRFWEMMQAQAVIRSNQGISLVPKGTGVHTEQYTFAGIADVYDRFMMDVAGAARIPVTKLFGRSPSGMNATGESDMINYYDYIDGVRENTLRPILEKLVPIMCLSAWGAVPDDIDIVFPPMQTPDEEKNASIVEKKTGAIIAAYNANLIDQGTALKELKDLDGLFDKITDEQINGGEGVYSTQQLLMRDPLMGLGE